MSTLDQMQAFVAVIEEGSFTAAAIKFGISPTAICKRVSMLERSLNTRLLIRTPRLIAATDTGKKYYAQCKKVLYEYKLSSLLIENNDNIISGTLNIVCMRKVAQELIYPSMAAFLEKYPDIVTNVTLKKQAHDINLSHFDLAIGYEISEIFNDWCSSKLGELFLFYPSIKPKPQKLQVYIDYLTQKKEDLSAGYAG